MRHRRVSCQGTDGRDVSESDCPLGEKPPGSDICDMGSCSANTWFFTEWTGQVNNSAYIDIIISYDSDFNGPLILIIQCSEECGTGIQTRKAHCSGNNQEDCDSAKKPETTRTCVSAKDCSGKWFTGPWSQVFHNCSLSAEHNQFVELVLRIDVKIINNLHLRFFDSVRLRAMREPKPEKSFV